jgi:hypothetical protein
VITFRLGNGGCYPKPLRNVDAPFAVCGIGTTDTIDGEKKKKQQQQQQHQEQT